MKQALDFRDESRALHALLEPLAEEVDWVQRLNNASHREYGDEA